MRLQQNPVTLASGFEVATQLDQEEREGRRETFLGGADDYHAARPAYPDVLLAAALSLGGLSTGSRVLEVGCGTGQLTVPLASRGLLVRAIDRSPAMIALVGERLAAFPNVVVACEDFEAGQGTGNYHGLVFGTSFHWLAPGSRVQRCAGSLEPGGVLILLWHVHPEPYTDFFARVEPIYRAVFPGRESPGSPGMSEARIQAVCDELLTSEHFDSVTRRSHDWERSYDRDLYLRLLNTYSDHRRLPETTRRELYDALSRVIEDEYDGKVTRPYRTELIVARRARFAG